MSNDSLQILAQSLKYLGLMIGTASSVWGALHELKEEGPQGKKRLTTAGRLSIGITIVSFVASLTSAAVGDKLAREADRAAQAKRQDEFAAQIKRHQELLSGQVQALDEAERTRSEQHAQLDTLTQRGIRSTTAILAAGQPLHSIEFEWVFPGLTPQIARYATDARNKIRKDVTDFSGTGSQAPSAFAHPSSEDIDTASSIFNRTSLLTPVLNSLGDAGWSKGSVVALFALDDTESAVVPLGSLSLAEIAPEGKTASSNIRIRFCRWN